MADLTGRKWLSLASGLKMAVPGFVGGSHAHRLKPLVEKLRIPTVVITDIDPTQETVNATTGKKSWTATANTGDAGLKCGNSTLRQWHPKLETLDDFKTPSAGHLTWTGAPDCRVRFAWQLPVPEAGNEWPATFEDSLILTNIEWFKELNKLMEEAKADKGKGKAKAADADQARKIKPPTGALAAAARAVAGAATHAELLTALHTLMHGSFSKGDFAASIFERVAAGADLTCPKYIADALTWLQDELDPAGGVTS